MYLLRNKEDAEEPPHMLNLDLAVPNGHRIQQLFKNKGGEFNKGGFRWLCQTIGVKLEFAATVTPQQIGVSERDGISLMKKQGA